MWYHQCITALKVFMKSFKGVCLWGSLFVSGLNQCRTWNCFACYGIFSEVGTAILAGSVLQNLYYLSPSGAIPPIVTSQWGHLVACGAGIALDREYQCRSLYGLENWAFIQWFWRRKCHMGHCPHVMQNQWDKFESYGTFSRIILLHKKCIGYMLQLYPKYLNRCKTSELSCNIHKKKKKFL